MSRNPVFAFRRQNGEHFLIGPPHAVFLAGQPFESFGIFAQGLETSFQIHVLAHEFGDLATDLGLAATQSPPGNDAILAELGQEREDGHGACGHHQEGAPGQRRALGGATYETADGARC